METNGKWTELGWRAARLEEGAEQTVLFHLSETQRAFEEVRADLARQAAEVERRAASTVRSVVEAGQDVNELGELQSSGPRFDMLCAVYQERARTLRRALHMARSLGVEVSDEEVF